MNQQEHLTLVTIAFNAAELALTQARLKYKECDQEIANLHRHRADHDASDSYNADFDNMAHLVKIRAENGTILRALEVAHAELEQVLKLAR